jgi:hypothetical protein
MSSDFFVYSRRGNDPALQLHSGGAAENEIPAWGSSRKVKAELVTLSFSLPASKHLSEHQISPYSDL